MKLNDESRMRSKEQRTSDHTRRRQQQDKTDKDVEAPASKLSHRSRTFRKCRSGRGKRSPYMEHGCIDVSRSLRKSTEESVQSVVEIEGRWGCVQRRVIKYGTVRFTLGGEFHVPCCEVPSPGDRLHRSTARTAIW
ncbi:hypothetical protein KIN20_031509 [Parelaphostrongylus tenuis]|uniref:Uncharacterized protein n=1 Tax=Parelaphostrongylus tenuis TaxID=148309 RepID=A0AAD5R587_PARTN|nr:hypothetical protein KIN20_031509 [Parelaphostrongylus tenuis]